MVILVFILGEDFNDVGCGTFQGLAGAEKHPCVVVVDAVIVEPVSTPEFPANREKNREFCKIVAFEASETANNGAVTGLPMRIPCPTEQGIVLAEEGLLAPEQGILSVGIETIAE